MTSTQEIDNLKEINQLQKVILKQMNEKPARIAKVVSLSNL